MEICEVLRRHEDIVGLGHGRRSACPDHAERPASDFADAVKNRRNHFGTQ